VVQCAGSVDSGFSWHNLFNIKNKKINKFK
jgi:hypothetical protein